MNATMMLLILMAAVQIHSPASIPKKPLVTKDGEKVVCKLITEADSRIPVRLCRTEAQWEEMAKANQDDIRSSRNSRIACGYMLVC